MTQSAALPQRGTAPHPASAPAATTRHRAPVAPEAAGRRISGSAVRRTLTALGVVLSLGLGIATIRAAAAWTASAAPLEEAPPSIAELNAALQVERARSQFLLAQLDALSASSAELETALAAAEQRIAQDATDADALNASLADARQRLAKLEASLLAARAPAPAAAPVAPIAVPTAATRGAHDEHDDDHDEDEPDEH
jgi:septal ring factor EnvC (AmiA/AmiB activator)